jgi:UDP-N-acetylmuramyl pentapeptide phosphotransferase/UDP-N-acetylglucosamine-1-phosphate transferase
MYIALLVLSAFAISYFAIKTIIRFAHSNNWLDEPDPRKSHSSPTPRLGGAGIFIGVIIPLAICLMLHFNWQNMVIIIGAISIFLTGILDDLKNVSVKIRFFIELIIAIALVHSGLILPFELFLPGNYPAAFNSIVSIIFIVGVINAFNLIDGINGLLGTLSSIGFIGFAILFYNSNNYFLVSICLIYLVSIISFLKFNFRNPAQIFMGDSGSLSIGFWMSVLFLSALKPNHPGAQNPFLTLSFILIPLLDMTRVIFGRLIKSHSPFQADKTHLHHLFLKCHYSHLSSTIIIGGIGLQFIYLMIVFRDLPGITALITIALITIAQIIIILMKKIHRKSDFHVSEYNRKYFIRKAQSTL